MATKTVNLYLYLARRDKSDIRLIAKLVGREQLPIRLDDAGLLSLQLPPTWYTQFSQTIYDNRMLWEPWIQSIDTFENFRAALKKRGYKNIPVSSQPEFTASTVQTTTVNVASLPSRKTMIRKSQSSLLTYIL